MQTEAGHGGRRVFAWLMPSFASLLWCLASGCGPDDVELVVEAPPWIEVQSDAACSRFPLLRGLTPMACRKSLLDVWRPSPLDSYYSRLSRAGRIEIDLEVVRSCSYFVVPGLEGLVGDWWSLDCIRVGVVGKVPLDESCRAGFECDSGYCEGPIEGCGVCRKPVSIGESCLHGYECATGQCNGVCVAHVATGECATNTDCRTGDICGAAGCLLPQSSSVNKECLTSFECVPGLSCRRQVHGAPRYCSQLGGLGAECERSTDCEVGLGCRATTVDSLGVCSMMPTLGETCWQGQYSHFSVGDCADGLVCGVGSANEMSCRAHQELGSPCQIDMECIFAGGQCVDGLCTPLGVAGNPCSPFMGLGDLSCALGHFCANIHLNGDFRCLKVLGGTGDSCDDDYGTICLDGLECSKNTSSDGRCTALNSAAWSLCE